MLCIHEQWSEKLVQTINEKRVSFQRNCGAASEGKWKTEF